jgi:hypothetical protein
MTVSSYYLISFFKLILISLVLATVLLSGQEYPTIHLVLPCLVQLETHLLRAKNDIVHFLREVAETMLKKFYKYYRTFPNLLVFAHALNPVYKLDLYSMYLETYHSSDFETKFHDVKTRYVL